MNCSFLFIRCLLLLEVPGEIVDPNSASSSRDVLCNRKRSMPAALSLFQFCFHQIAHNQVAVVIPRVAGSFTLLAGSRTGVSTQAKKRSRNRRYLISLAGFNDRQASRSSRSSRGKAGVNVHPGLFSRCKRCGYPLVCGELLVLVGGSELSVGDLE